MRRIDSRRQKWFFVRSRNQAKRVTVSKVKALHRRKVFHVSKFPDQKIVRAWTGVGIERVLCLNRANFPPNIICLKQNPRETLDFLNTLRDRLAIRNLANGPQKKIWVDRSNKRGLPQISVFTDFSKIELISTSSAVVLAAEYDRARRVMKSVPPTINLDEWSDAAFTTLYELGFFSIVGLTQETEQRYADSPSGDIRTMSMISGANSTELQAASESILELSRFIDEDNAMSPEIRASLNSAIGEAMSNVARHAYPAEYESPFVKVDRWWIAASANRKERILNVVVYDQGASIPWTLPKRSWASTLQGVVQDLLEMGKDDRERLGHRHDADYIEYAMGEGNTQTGEKGRGIGLPQMRDAVKICGGGSLTILSRGGRCSYNPNDVFLKEPLSTPIDGTLIEWEMHLPRISI